MELKDEIIGNRRYFHENPELGFELPLTLERVKNNLEEMGIKYESVGEAGISALIGKPGKTFLIRGDMDALPMAEETDLPFKSKNDYMHACGHDIHAAALLGAARLLKEREAELCGTVKLMFQPCEEGVNGARDMIENGILENPPVDAALALHVANNKSGSVGYSTGNICASSDVFKITISGKAAHGAASYLGIDPINTAAHLHLALQVLNSREIYPDEMVVLTIGVISAGKAANVIPETCVLKGTIRTMNNETRKFITKRLVEITDSVAQTFRADGLVEFYGEGVPPMINDAKLTTELIGYIDDMLGEGTSRRMARITASEDFSLVSQLVPSVLLWVGTGSPEEGYPYSVHNPRVTFNEEVIPKFSAIYAECAIKWLENHAE